MIHKRAVENRIFRCKILPTLGVVLRGVFATVFFVGVFLSGNANAQDSTASAPETAERTSSIAGITGHYRVGGWTAIQLSESDVSIETLDGDGVRVVYDQPAKANQPRFGYVMVGSESAPLILRDADDQVTVSTRFPALGSPAKGASLVPLEMPWIVSVGNPLGIDKIGANELLDRDPQVAVSKPAANEFPDSAIGYDGVDLFVITGTGHEVLGALNDRQIAAIVDWVQSGGRLFLTLGKSTKKLQESAPWLLDLLPLETDTPVVSEMHPSAFETYTSTQTRLSNFSGIRLPKGAGKVLIMGRTARRVSTPFAAEYVSGLGRVTVITADLDVESFAQWPERMSLLEQVLGKVISLDNKKQNIRRSTAFDDLAGQTRGTLDQFNVSRRFGFSILSLILMGLIALIGPLDYLLINRVFGKPLLGWLTFPIVVLGLSAILAWQATPLPAVGSAGTSASVESKVQPDSPNDLLRCNRIEVFDIDAIEQRGRGFSWNYVFSHHANQFDVSVDASEKLSAAVSEITEVRNAPFGNPGPSFGGIQIAGEDASLGSYRVTADDQEKLHTSIQGLAIAPRSSKSLATWVTFKPNLESVPSMNKTRGSDELRGELVNPLNVDLLDAMLIYRNWVYILPTRFPAGGKIRNIQKVRQKNFRWQLSRQDSLGKESTKSESWEPGDFGSPKRVAEMLMFHNAVGGTRYTSLKNNPLSFLDLSHLLSDDRCMLVGRLKQPMTRLGLTNSQEENTTPIFPSGNVVPMLRLIMPVKEVSRNRN